MEHKRLNFNRNNHHIQTLKEANTFRRKSKNRSD